MHFDMSKHQSVDTHFHIFDRAHAVPGARYVPDYDASIEAWRELAVAEGVARGVLVQTSFLGTDNSQLVRALQAQPDVLRGVAVVAPTVDFAELQALDSVGVRGIRLNLAGRSTDLGAWRQARGVWDQLLQLGWHVELHTDRGALSSVLPQLPQAIPLVVDHMGKPDAVQTADRTIQVVRRCAAGRQVWVKLSGPYRLGGLDASALAKMWLGELGDGSLLWGSDWPFTNHEHDATYPLLRAELEQWLPEPARRRALVENPQALYWAR